MYMNTELSARAALATHTFRLLFLVINSDILLLWILKEENYVVYLFIC